jgi:hypothetical protein
MGDRKEESITMRQKRWGIFTVNGKEGNECHDHGEEEGGKFNIMEEKREEIATIMGGK